MPDPSHPAPRPAPGRMADAQTARGSDPAVPGRRGLRRRQAALVAAALAADAGHPFAAERSMAGELASVRTRLSVSEAIDRVQGVVAEAGFGVLARVDHAAGAASVGLALRPTELLIFANPRGGTPLMQCDQRVGIDLPLRALAWQDEDGQVRVAMVDPQALRRRHLLGPGCDAPLAAMERLVARVLGAVAEA